MKYNDYMNSLEPSEELKKKTSEFVESAVNEHNRISAKRRKTVILALVCIAFIAVSLTTAIIIKDRNKPTVVENDTFFNSETNKSTEVSVDPVTTTEEPMTEPLSYDEFFSKVRPYEIKKTEYNYDYRPASWSNIYYITNFLHAGQDIDYFNGHKSGLSYKIDVEFRDDRLYKINDAKKVIEGYFSDYSVYPVYRDNSSGKDLSSYDYDYNAFVLPFSCRKEGVYTVINHNEFVLLDYEGSMVNSIYTAKGPIKNFYVLDTVAWVFSEGTIYRIYLPDGTVDKILGGIVSDRFYQFYYPISNFEIQWGGTDENGTSCSFYYNAKTGKSKTKRRIVDLSEEDMRGTATNTGWWFVPEDSYERIDDFVCTLPEEYERSEIIAMGLDPKFSCGGGVAIWKYTERVNASEKVGWISINYDFKPVFEDGRLVDVENVPSSRYRIYKVNPIEDNSNVVITIGDFDPWWADKFKNYRFAFACKGENEPVYALILRSDVCTAEEFQEIVKTIEIS